MRSAGTLLRALAWRRVPSGADHAGVHAVVRECAPDKVSTQGVPGTTLSL